MRVSPWLGIWDENDLDVCETLTEWMLDIDQFYMALKTQKSSGYEEGMVDAVEDKMCRDGETSHSDGNKREHIYPEVSRLNNTHDYSARSTYIQISNCPVSSKKHTKRYSYMVDTIPPIFPSAHPHAYALLAVFLHTNTPLSALSFVYSILNIHNVQQVHPSILLDSKVWPRNHRRRLL